MAKEEDNLVNDDTSFPTLSSPPSLDESGKQIGPYKLLKKLGEGGWGIVYLAEQAKPIKRQVALKLIKRGMESKQVLARFEAERQALALLDSPYIAHVYDAGMTEDGRPYFAMEYIQGLQITDYCDQHKLSIKERLQLFIQVCEGIQHAHQKGIIHRDIKPSNILVSMQDEKAIPKIIDFGVAKALLQPLTEKTIYTEEGQLIGTPEYMSPEQAQISQENVDIRSDVYSLGILLYELLTGTLPFDRKSLRLAAFYEILRIIREQDPPRPSAKLSTLGPEAVAIAKNRGLAMHSLKNTLNKELEWIPLKAIRKEPSHRYQTALEFIKDIQNYLAGEPLSAGPESSVYRLKKFVKKRRAWVAAVTTIGAILIVSLIIISRMYLNSERLRISAVESEKVAQEEKNKTQEALEKETIAKNEVERQSYRNYIAWAIAAYKEHDYARASELLDACPKALRCWVWGWIYNSFDQSQLTIKENCFVTSVGFSPDGKRIASGGAGWFAGEGIIKIRDAESGNELLTLTGHKGRVYSVCFSPDGKRIASGSEDETVIIWDSNSGSELLTLTGHKGNVNSVSFSPDGLKIVSGSEDKTIKIWDINTASELLTLTGHEGNVYSVKFSPDGKRIASGSRDGTIKIWDAVKGSELLTLSGHGGEVYSVCFSPDGRKIASGGGEDDDSTIRVWDVDSGSELLTLNDHQSVIRSIYYKPDGRQIISGGYGPIYGDHYYGSLYGIIKIWDSESHQQVQTLSGHQGRVYSVCFSSDGKWIASGSEDETIRIWDSNSGSELLIMNGYSVNFSPDCKRIASSSRDGIKIWDADTGNELLNLTRYEGAVISVCFRPDGKQIVSGSEDGTIKIWDADTASELLTLTGHEGNVYSVKFSPDGKRIASGSRDGTIKIWDADSGNELLNLTGHQGEVISVCFSPDGKRIASGSEDETIIIWDSDSGSELLTLTGHKGNVNSVSFSPHGMLVASAGEDETVRIWDTENGSELLTLSGHTGQVYSICFSPDGKRIASGSEGGTITIWNSAKSKDSIIINKKSRLWIPKEPPFMIIN